MALGDAAGEEAALANVVVEMFQAPISAEITRSSRRIKTEKEVQEGWGRGRKKEKSRRESIKEGNLQLCFLHGRSS